MAAPDAPPAAYCASYHVSEKPCTVRTTEIPTTAAQHSPSTDPAYSKYFPNAQIAPGVTPSRTSQHDSVISYPKSPLDSYAASARSMSYSVNNDRRKESSTSSDLERNASLKQDIQYPKPVMSRDPEKRWSDLSTTPRRDPRPPRSGRDVEQYHLTYDEDDECRIEENTFSILVHLSLLLPLMSFGILFYTIACAFLGTLLLPFRAITSADLPTFSSMIFPPLRLQLRMIYSPYVKEEIEPRSGTLAVVHIFSPFLSPLVAVCSWVVALFWFFSAVLGDPAGKDGHNDGRSAVLWIRAKWEFWLLSGLKNQR